MEILEKNVEATLHTLIGCFWGYLWLMEEVFKSSLADHYLRSYKSTFLIDPATSNMKLKKAQMGHNSARRFFLSTDSRDIFSFISHMYFLYILYIFLKVCLKKLFYFIFLINSPTWLILQAPFSVAVLSHSSCDFSDSRDLEGGHIYFFPSLSKGLINDLASLQILPQ